MTRYISNLPEWTLDDLIVLRDEAMQDFDACYASGNPDSTTITHSQLDFIKKLIIQKGGTNPTFDEESD